MKKLIAIFLALLMLGSVTAFADSAPIFTLSDPVVLIESPDQPSQTVDLTGLAISVSPITGANDLTVALNVLMNDQPALVAAAKIVGERAFLAMNGLSNTYFVDIPTEQIMAATQIDPADLGIDVEALAQQIMSELVVTTEGETTHFTLPYTAVNNVLETLAPAIAQFAASQGLDTAEFENTIAQLKQSDSGITVEGSLTQAEMGISADCNFLLVQGGQTAPNPIATVKFFGNADDIQVHGELEMAVATDGGEPQTALIVNVNVGQEVPNFDLTIRVPSEEASFTFSFDAESSTVSIIAAVGGMNAMVSFKVAVTEGELVVCPVDEAGALDIQNLTQEQTQQLQNEAMQAVSPLLNALAQVMG